MKGKKLQFKNSYLARQEASLLPIPIFPKKQQRTYVVLLHVTAISTWWIVVPRKLFELLPRGKKRISLIANIFFSYSRVSERRRVAEKDSPLLFPFHLSSPRLAKEKGEKETGRGEEKSEKKERKERGME